MKYVLLFLFALFINIPALAAADTKPAPETKPTATEQLTTKLANMTDAQKAEVLNSLNKNTEEAAGLAQKMEAIGTGIGRSLVATAHELGIAVNEFASSTVGKITIFLIVWNYAGHDIMSVLFCVFVLVVLVPLTLRSYKRFNGVFDEKGKFIRYNLAALGDPKDNGAAATMTGIHVIALVLEVVIVMIKWP